MRCFSTGGTSLNLLAEEEWPERIAAAYGRRILGRLAALKAVYDPDNLFRHTKSITGSTAG